MLIKLTLDQLVYIALESNTVSWEGRLYSRYLCLFYKWQRYRFFRTKVWLFCRLLKKGDITVIRNFEKAIVLKVKIVKRLKVEVVSYNWLFRQNFWFNNLKETSSKIQGASYNRVHLITEKIRYISYIRYI